ncbi:MAG: hypothetical protein CMF71_07110 [Magnetovibrio sp.]|nr:hypothetical protein [Magnetovibrio sp.]|tara:strand:- start:1725 stop:1940 length:216 start_codon:yes stop_codon:yes gene_type:complete
MVKKTYSLAIAFVVRPTTMDLFPSTIIYIIIANGSKIRSLFAKATSFYSNYLKIFVGWLEYMEKSRKSSAF